MDRDELDRWFMHEILPLEGDLVRYLRHKWHDRSEVPDLMQETYARVYEAARRERPQQTRAFVFAIARNLLIDKLRHSSVISIETVADFDGMLVVDNEPDPERHVTARQELRFLQAALDTLPERCRQIVVMKKVEGYSQREIAQKMGVTEVMVEHQVVKAVRLLTQALSNLRNGTAGGMGRVRVLKRRKVQ
jgi:RNA polymerase sigma factor (sigma-70 family)